MSLESATVPFMSDMPDDMTGTRRPVQASPVLSGSVSATPPNRAPRLIGRDAEIAALLGALDDLRAGKGRAIALVGEPGIGKSALMFAAAAHARAAGAQVRALLGRSALLPRLLRMHGGDSGLRRLAEQAANGGPVMVGVDDLHNLAADQIPGIETLIRAAADGPVLAVMAYRQRQLSPGFAAVLARAASAGLLEVWNPAPLSREQAGELLGERPGLDAAHRESGGNPQYLKVIAGDGAAGADGDAAILGELAELDPTALYLVRTAAVLGEPFHPELLAEVTGLEEAETLRVLDELTRLDLVRPTGTPPQLALRHRAVGEVVYQRIEPSRRIALHRAAEAALARRNAPILLRARHVARAPDPSRPDHATTLIAAAREALHSAPAVAAEHLRAALSMLKDGDPYQQQGRVLLARARLIMGDATDSRALLDVVRLAAPDQLRRDPAAFADASRIERRLGRHFEAGAIARSGLAALADDDSVMAGALHTELAYYAYDLQDFDTSRQHADTAAEIARRHGSRVCEAYALAQSSLAHLFVGELAVARTRVDRAAEIVDATSDAALLTNLDALYQLGLAEGTLGLLADSERHLTRGADLCRGSGQLYIQPVMLMALINTQVRSGNLVRALETLDEAARHAEHAGNPATRAIIVMLRSEALLWRNSTDDLGSVIAPAERAAEFAEGHPTAWAASVRCFHAELVALTGDPVRAGRLLLDVAGGAGLPQLTAWRRPRCCDTLVQAALAEGDQASAGDWASLAEACVDVLPSLGRRAFARRARMRVHAANGATSRALACARDAIADFAAAGERIELCRTLLAAAALGRDAGRTAEADGWLERAAVLAQQCGSARLADEVAQLRNPEAGPAGRAALTAREREIAELTSTGMTSGEIAGTLCLSVRTVDSHLGRIYRKLGVANRAGLTRAMLS
jgi:DNA-binding CsgD family transcriptional regulator